MALNNKLKALEICIGNRRSGQKPESEEDLEELESDVNKMEEKILQYRASIPDQLKTTLDSLSIQFSLLKDPACPASMMGRSPDYPENIMQVDSEEMDLDKERRTEEKIGLLEEKISSNVSAMPVVVKRMTECISRIEKLDSCNGIIHPAFSM